MAAALESALIGQRAHQARIATAGAMRFAVDVDMPCVVSHSRTAVELHAAPDILPCPRLEPDLGLGLGQPFAERALEQQRVGQHLCQCLPGKALQRLGHGARRRGGRLCGIAVELRRGAKPAGCRPGGPAGPAPVRRPEEPENRSTPSCSRRRQPRRREPIRAAGTAGRRVRAATPDSARSAPASSAVHRRAVGDPRGDRCTTAAGPGLAAGTRRTSRCGDRPRHPRWHKTTSSRPVAPPARSESATAAHAQHRNADPAPGPAGSTPVARVAARRAAAAGPGAAASSRVRRAGSAATRRRLAQPARTSARE